MLVCIVLCIFEQEGLLCKIGCGYRVCVVICEDIVGVVEVCGVLEGLVVCQVVECGLFVEVWVILEECLVEGD